jgi:hypothetical protein
MASVGGGATRSSVAAWLRDVLRYPYRRFDIDTELSQTEVAERLRSIVEPGSAFFAAFRRTNKLFAGEISSDGFKIRTLKYYPNPYLAVLVGRLEPGPIGTQVKIAMRLRRFVQVLIVIWSAAMLFACVSPFLLSPPSAEKSVSFFTLYTPLEWIALVMGGVSFAYVVVGLSFGIEARKARGLIEETLQRVPGQRVQTALEGVRPRLPRVAKFLLGCAAAMVVMILGIQSFIARSEPYHIAEGYVRSDPAIRSQLGAIGKVDLDPWKSAQIKYYGKSEGVAIFSLRVIGSRGKGTVFFQMRKHQRVWAVNAANLREPDGRIIPLRVDAAAAIAPVR